MNTTSAGAGSMRSPASLRSTRLAVQPVMTDARNDLANDASVAGDADALAEPERLIVVEVSGGEDLVAAT
jgi:hypothetical protein